jgi:UDP-N-acetylglucosamine 3-dehydrogenase
VNVLLVGLGRWGERHLRVLRDLGAAVWVAEVSPARRGWAIDHGVDPRRVVQDHRSALEQVEAVDVVTPADSHLALAVDALDSGRHCFVEKPLTLRAAEGRLVAAAARRAGRVLQVGHVFRFHPVTAAVREVLASGRLGAIRFATARFDGFKRPRLDVGVTQTDAIHFFDLFADLLGRPASSVSAIQRDFLGRGLDDLSMSCVTYGEVPVLVEANYFVPGARRECVVVGECGSLAADFAAGTVTLHLGEHRRRDGAWEAVDAGKEELTPRGDEPLRLELASFLAACAGGPPPAVGGDEGVHALEVVEAAALSARLGRAVRLDEVR